MFYHEGYERRDVIHRGVRSTVVRAVRRADGRPVVLKYPSEEIPSPEHRRRLRRELEVGQRLAAVGGLTYLELVTSGASEALVMEDVGAQALERRLAKVPVALPMWLADLLGLAGQLAALHELGLAHGGLTPSNALVAADGQLFLCDLGSALALDGVASPPSPAGSMIYLAPEQSGRGDRPVDHRADLYSLGAVGYHLLTGRPPFELEDPQELRHAHQARIPEPASVLRPGVPGVVDQLLARLLAKDPAERYQTARGVAADLRRCQMALATTGAVAPFLLGTRDWSTRLTLEAGLVGRDAEVAALTQAVDGARPGRPQVVVLRGASGVGKTALWSALSDWLVERRARLARGGFEALRRHRPYSALLDALRGVLREVLSLPPAPLAAARARLEDAVGSQLALLSEPLPEVVQILGARGEAPPVAGLAEPARFPRVMESAIAALSSPEQPLVLFVDDVQWADDASLRLLESLAAGSGGPAVLVMAYRDEEVGPGHPVALALAAIAAVATVHTVEVGPLGVAATFELLRLWLRPGVDGGEDVAARLHASTGGNPFFLRQLVASLHRAGALTFDTLREVWVFDVAAIDAHGLTDNVLGVMVRELATLSEDERQALGVAALLGSRFELEAVAEVTGLSPDVVAARLGPAVARRYLVQEPTAQGALRFTHDRVQQAAHQLIPLGDRLALHRAIGRWLRQRKATGEGVFGVTAHLNAARSLLDAGEVQELVGLNLEAARLAQASSAWRAALSHLDVARELLGPDVHADPRWLEVGNRAAEASYVLGDWARAEAETDAILRGARGVEDRTTAYRVRLLTALAENRLTEGIATARQLAGAVGVRLPLKVTTRALVGALLRTRWRLRGHDEHSLAALPLMREPRALAGLELLSSVITSAFLAEPELYPMVVFEMVRLTLDHGLGPASPEGLAAYGMVLSVALDDLEGAARMVGAARAVLARTGASHRGHRVALAEGAFVTPWARPLQASVDQLLDAHRVGAEAGDTEFASLAMSTACFHALVAGQPLDELEVMLVRHLDAIQRTHHKHGEGDVRRQLQFVRNLRGLARDPVRMRSATFDEDQDLATQQRAGVKNAESALAYYQATLALIFRDLPRARERIDASHANLSASRGTLLAALIRFVRAVVHLQLGQRTGAREALRLLRRRARSAPSTFQHLAELVAAELDRLAGRYQRAARRYEAAVAGALKARMPHDAALASELAARFWHDRDLPTIARGYFARASQLYRSWGAEAKVRALEVELGATARPALQLAPERPDGLGVALTAAIRASNAIAAERTVDGVVHRVLSCLVEDAGARRAVLLRADAPDQLRVVAELTGSGELSRIDAPLEGHAGLPGAIVRYVHRAGVPLVLADAAGEGEFTQDPYVVAHRLRSVLCAPVVFQGQRVGVIYLENELTAGGFSGDRLGLVAMLAGQAAVSLANAELYQSLERRVRERTDALELRNRFIRETFGRYLSDDIVDQLLATEQGRALGGERRRVTIVMSDLRGFSALAERLTPEQTVTMLNAYLATMTEIIFRYQGTVDEIIGDGILSIFGAPTARPDDAERGVACALAMQAAMSQVNAWNVEHGLPTVEMGIGVNTGDVVVGNIGSKQRAKYGVVGSQVNLTSRIESYSVGGQVLVAPSTMQALTSAARVEGHLMVHPKGAAAPMTLHDVTGLEGPHRVSLDRGEDSLQPVGQPAAVELTVLRGKSLDGPTLHGTVVGLAAKHAELALDGEVAPLSDVRIRWLEASAGGAEIYAKLVATSAGRARFRFTSVGSESQAYLDGLRRH